ncbi:hypothetical protein EsH8_X_000074 [Colletotrichum jinshuiense]
MPPKKTTATASAPSPSHGFTPSEINMMLAILQQIQRPTIDFDGLAVAIGAASGHSARVRMSAAANKHGWFAHAARTGDNGTPVTPRSKKNTGDRKNKTPIEEGQGEEAETPPKKKARTSKANDKVEAEPVEEAPVRDTDSDGVQKYYGACDMAKMFDGNNNV